MSDLSKFEASDTGWLHFNDSAGEPMYRDGDESKPMRAEIYGPGTVQHAKVKARQQTRNFQRLRKKGSVEVTTAEQLAERIEDLVTLTKGFENIDLDPKAVYGNRRLGFMADQAEEYHGDWANFPPGSATS